MANARWDFTGRSILVTGAGRGIGLAVARRFATAGATVTRLDLDLPEPGETPDAVPFAHALPCDVRDPAAVTRAVAEVVDRVGSVDVLVNNAGILRDRMLWKLSDQDWDDVLAVHLTGTFNCTRAAVPFMRESGFGRIINVTSYTGLHGNIGQANYAAAKAGIIGFTRSAAKELAPFGVTVNAVSPNADTAMVQSIPEERRRELADQIPMRRFGSVDEMAETFAYLASDEAGYVTGVVLAVDGGLSI